MEMKGFMFLRGYRDAIHELPKELRLRMYEIIMDYALDGILPQKQEGKTEDYAIAALFKSIQPTLDKSIRNYRSKCENGAKGGRPKQKETESNRVKPNETKDMDKEMVMENEKATDKERESEKELLGEDDPYKVVVELPLLGGAVFQVKEHRIPTWQINYPNVNVRQQLVKMREWFKSNPSDLKREGEIIEFINDWFAQEQSQYERYSN